MALTRRLKWLALGITLLWGLLLAGCGVQPPPVETAPPLVINDTVNNAVLTLPIVVADRLGLFAHQHLRVILRPDPAAPLSLSWAGSRWPIEGVLAVRPDLVLVSPIPDPHFRLRALRHLPLFLTPAATPEEAWARQVLALHQVVGNDWKVIPKAEVLSLWAQRRLPWVMVPLSEWPALKNRAPDSRILAWIGASTGPLPTVVITGHPARPGQLTTFLAAVNLALWYIHTTPAAQVAQLIGRPTAEEIATIRQADHYGIWPAVTRLDPATYRRGRQFWATGWPDYETGVRNHSADAALTFHGW
ncbi:MAG: hypothetical protein OWQ57_07360 [Sulfobacillus sp.]|nr:hypothetical protein [Sulfobacillus sp.]